MKRILEELKRRNVFKVGAAYIVVSWVALQFVDVIQDPLSLPAWLPRVVIVLLTIGFPIALIISWAFELTPSGLIKTSTLDRTGSAPPRAGQGVNRLITGGLILAVAFLLVDRFHPIGGEPGPALPENLPQQTSVAVLPFVNMSGEPDQEFFSDGMTEEILNVLARNRALRVAGRTSSFAYKGRNEDLRSIGQQLGVAYLIEGSVRKEADTVRITAQLVKVEDGFHVWSETYDRQLTEIFAVQDEIARAISDALEVSFGGDRPGPSAVNQTDNMAAYDLYLQARDAHKHRYVQEAIGLAQRVTAMDPDFAPGWGLLAQGLALAPSWIYTGDPMESAGALSKAYIAAQQALLLDPEQLEALGAVANVHRSRLQWHEAEVVYLQALSIDPDNPVILEDYIEFLITVGKVKAALPLARKLLELDPYVAIYLHAQVMAHLSMGDYEAALPLAQKEAELGPDRFHMVSAYARTLWLAGQRQQAREIWAQAEGMPAQARAELETWFDAGEKGLAGLTSEQRELAMSTPAILSTLGLEQPFFALLSAKVRLGWWGDHFTFNYSTKPFRKSPGFKAHVVELKLVDYWRQDGWGDYCRPVGTNDFACE